MIVVGEVQGVGKKQLSHELLTREIGSKIRCENITVYVAQDLLIFLR